MSRYLLFFGCVLLGVLPCKSQDVIVLHKENKLTGRVLWEKSKGDSLFYRSAVSSGDSLLLFVPRRRVEYVLSDGDRRMLYRGKTRGSRGGAVRSTRYRSIGCSMPRRGARFSTAGRSMRRRCG